MMNVEAVVRALKQELEAEVVFEVLTGGRGFIHRFCG